MPLIVPEETIGFMIQDSLSALAVEPNTMATAVNNGGVGRGEKAPQQQPSLL